MDFLVVLPADTVLWDAAFLEAALALEASTAATTRLKPTLNG